ITSKGLSRVLYPSIIPLNRFWTGTITAAEGHNCEKENVKTGHYFACSPDAARSFMEVIGARRLLPGNSSLQSRQHARFSRVCPPDCPPPPNIGSAPGTVYSTPPLSIRQGPVTFQVPTDHPTLPVPLLVSTGFLPQHRTTLRQDRPAHSRGPLLPLPPTAYRDG